MMMCPPPSDPPGPAATLMPDPGSGEVPAAVTAPLSTLLEIVEPPFWQAPFPAMVTSGQRPHDSTSAGPPRLYPPLPVSTDGEGKENTGIRQRLRSTKEQGESYRCPSESYNSLRLRTHVGTTIPPCSLLLPAIFLYGYIKLAETHSTVLGGATTMIRLMETIFQTHRPT
ncbi:unnamed protein product [Rangifer tarandus platyrhynchus]|uniref:Uncharacterized protein n=2 Tax=Rangifer tarandus platyrhynchus TaxID=3082113 RepID=A0ABN8ZBQ5_RANTA|nr:unnamed protein product [Rangifer tarandus platyrhynchus]